MRKRREEHVGVLDIGSNSVRLVIYHIYGRSFTPIFNEKVLAGLGRNLHKTGRLSPDGKRLAIKALKRFKALADNLSLSRILIAATAALRDGTDAKDFIEYVRQNIGFDIRPLSGEEEARAAAFGVLAGEPRAYGICADLGGASLELIEINNAQPTQGRTYKLGPFSVFQDGFKIPKARVRIGETLKQGMNFQTNQNLYLVGGAWRNLALIHQKRTDYPLRISQNFSLDIQKTMQLAQWAYSNEGRAIIATWPGLSPRRAETLPYSGLLLEELIKTLSPKQILIAPGGLRDGLVYQYMGAPGADDCPLLDGCQDLAHGNEHGIGFGAPLFAFLQNIHGICPAVFEPENETRLRRAACELVGIGKGLHPQHKAKIVFRSVLYAPVFALTHKERCYLALMLFASYTSKSVTPNDAALKYHLTEYEQMVARTYGLAMRLAVTLTARSTQILKRLAFTTHADEIRLNVPIDLKPLFVDKTNDRIQTLSERLAHPISVHFLTRP